MKKTTLSFLLCLFANIFYSTAQTVAAGGSHSLFVCDSGAVRATGSNLNGQLGNGTSSGANITTPITVNGINDVVAVAARDQFSLFLKSDGTVWACGNNTYGELGIGTTVNSNVAVQVQGLTGIIKIAAGYYHSLFLKNDGTVWACGRNFSGELGNGNQIQQNTPVQATSLNNIIDIAAGDNHSIFVQSDGTVKICGDNQNGALGLGNSNGPVVSPATVAINDVVSVAAGMRNSVFVKNDGTVWVSGINTYGQVGDGTITDKLLPTQVTSLSGIIAAAAGQYHIIYLKNNGTVWACGYNGHGQLGIGNYNNISTPEQVTGLTDVVSIAASGLSHSLFAKSDNTFYACGQNAGALGNGTDVDSNIPTEVIANCASAAGLETVADFVSLYPNPVSDVLHFSEQVSQVKIYDMYGRQINADYTNNTVIVNHLATGTYILYANTKNGKTINQKFIKN